MTNSAHPDRPVRILHLEDNSCDAELLEVALTQAGVPYAIRRAETPESFEAALAEPADLIISDSKLPGFDAFRALELAREKCPGIPFVFFSGNVQPSAREDALRHGATGFISKDRFPELVALIRKIGREKQNR